MDFLNIGFTDLEKNMMEVNLIEYRKQMSQILSTARKRAKGDSCYFCGKKTTTFCESHYVPKFCLKNISVNGKLYYYNNFLDFKLIATDKGVKEAGTFSLICRSCDSKAFQDYENPDNYDTTPSEKMIAEIAMKDYLKFIYKRHFEKAMFDIIAEKNPFVGATASVQNEIKDLDLMEYEHNFEKAKRAMGSEANNTYDLFFYTKLPYVAPIAIQSLLVLVSDLKCKCVNNIYDYSQDYHPKDLHLAVLPIQDSTLVMLFCDANEPVYKGFINQFKELSSGEQLGVINYMIFLYTEDYFISPSISEEILNNAAFKEVTGQSLESFGLAFSEEHAREITLRKALSAFDLNAWKRIPNLLDERYKLR